jgi:hypothetical protein
LLNDTSEISGIYDSGSNVSLINSKLLCLKKNPINKNKKNANLKTINGVKKTIGMVTLKIKIFDIEKSINVFVIDGKDFDYDFLIGLDCIKQFRLVQDEKLEISQKIQNPTKGEQTEKTNATNQEVIPVLSGNNVEGKQNLQNTNREVDIQRNTRDEINGEYEINFNEHIEAVNFDISVNHLNFQQQSEIEELIYKYRSLFAKDKYDIGIVKGYDCYEARIDLLIDKYCSKRPYRCTIEDKKEIEQQVSKLLQKNLIEESYSPFAAPVTLAYKKEEGKRSRLCIDFRDLNKIVVPQSQPFSLIENLMVKTRGCKFFSTLDINSAFWSIPLKIEDKQKNSIRYSRRAFSVDMFTVWFKNLTSNFPKNFKYNYKKT